MKKSLCGLLMIVSQLPVSASAQNTYNANLLTKITDVVTYTDELTVLFKVTNPPVVPNCNVSHFVVPASVPAENRQLILSRLLTARAGGETIYIGYDGQTCGPLGFVRVYRVG